MRQVMRTMVKEEGILRPWRGMYAMAAGAGPAHAMYFTCLEVGKESAEKLNLPNNMAFLVDGMLILTVEEYHNEHGRSLAWGESKL